MVSVPGGMVVARRMMGLPLDPVEGTCCDKLGARVDRGKIQRTPEGSTMALKGSLRLSHCLYMAGAGVRETADSRHADGSPGYPPENPPKCVRQIMSDWIHRASDTVLIFCF